MNIGATSPKARVILGLMTFGPDPEAGARVTSLDDYNKCLDHLQSRGYNEVDTARVYVGGKQEGFTAAARWRDRGLTLATKVYPSAPLSHEPAVLRKALETSLVELKTDCVDIFYLHAADRARPFEPTLRECNKLHKEGKFVQLGVSNFTAFELAEVVMICKANGWVRPTIFQAMYNAITRSIESELIPACRRYGLDIVVYNPLAGGLFSGKFKSSDVPTEGRFSDTAKSGEMYRQRYFRNESFKALELVENAADKHQLTLVEIALRWLRHHSALRMGAAKHDGVILGVSSLAQLETNLSAIEKGELPEDVVAALDAAWAIVRANAPNYWHMDLKYDYDTVGTLFPPGGRS